MKTFVNKHTTSILERYAPQVEHALKIRVSNSVGDKWLRDAISYHLGWVTAEFQPLSGIPASGKKLRPGLVYMAYQAALTTLYPTLSLDLKVATPLAAALELLHNYSLIHDDIEDEDRLRRGRPTLWAMFGKAKAINVGDCLHAMAFYELNQLRSRGIKPENFAQITSTVAATSLNLTLGQNDDMWFESRTDIDTDMYLNMIENKTAALISCATYCGALLILDPKEPRQERALAAYAGFGRYLGISFQIWDDFLGIWGTEGEIGKPVGSDIRRRKKSMPIVYAMTNAESKQQRILRALYESDEPITLQQEAYVRQVLSECEADKFTQQQTRFYSKQAIDELTIAAGSPQVLQSNPFLQDLMAVTSYLTERTN
jgi:geranylgeranyl diphosphate synthase, type I